MWEAFVERQVEKYDKVMKRTPPILKLFVLGILGLWICLLVVVEKLGWLLGFYTCSQCGKYRQVMFRPHDEKKRCITCQNKPVEKKQIFL